MRGCHSELPHSFSIFWPIESLIISSWGGILPRERLDGSTYLIGGVGLIILHQSTYLEEKQSRVKSDSNLSQNNSDRPQSVKTIDKAAGPKPPSENDLKKAGAARVLTATATQAETSRALIQQHVPCLICFFFFFFEKYRPQPQQRPSHAGNLD